jgi:hypothetical protein
MQQLKLPFVPRLQILQVLYVKKAEPQEHAKLELVPKKQEQLHKLIVLIGLLAVYG